MNQPNILFSRSTGIKVQAVDLFCGVGGFTAGLLQAGIQVLGGVDFSRTAVDVYWKNFHLPVYCADIHAVHADELCHALGSASDRIDLIVAALPPLPFARNRPRFQTHERVDLILAFARIVTEIRPSMFIVECTTNMYSGRNRGVLATFQEMITAAGYRIQQNVLDAAHYGVPQVRPRHYYIGQRGGQQLLFAWPSPPHNRPKTLTVWDAIGDLPLPSPDAGGAGDLLHYHSSFPARLGEIVHGDHGRSLDAAGSTINVKGIRYSFLDGDRPSPSLHAGLMRLAHFVHPNMTRTITLREAARLQTFNDTFDFRGGNQQDRAQLIGGATPPMLAHYLGQAVYEHIYLETRLVDQRSRDATWNSAPLTNWGPLPSCTFQLLPTVSENTRILLLADGVPSASIIQQLLAMEARDPVPPYGHHHLQLPQTIYVDRAITRFQDHMRLHEMLGLCYEDGDQIIRVTAFGKTLLRWLDDLHEHTNHALCWHAIQALSVCQLASPLPLGQRYAPTTKVFPFRCIWSALLALDSVLTIDEINRVLLHVMTMDDLEPAIRQIAEARKNHDGRSLDEPALPESSIRHIHIWMSLASFGWTLVVPDVKDERPYQYRIRPEYTFLLAHGAALQAQPYPFTTADAYVSYVAQAAAVPEDVR